MPRPKVSQQDSGVFRYDPAQRVGTSGPVNARILAVGMAPAKEELREKIPLVGPSGRIFNNALRALGIDRSGLRVTNLVHFSLPHESSVRQVPVELLNREIERLHDEILETRPNVIVALGVDPLWYLVGKTGIQKWRGSILRSVDIRGHSFKVIPTIHPASILRGQWKWNAVFTHIDMKRAVEEAATPDINYPDRRSITGPSFSGAVDYLQSLHDGKYLAFDIETRWWRRDRMGEIACVAFSNRPDEAICIPFIRSNGSHYWNLEEESVLWRIIAGLLQNRRLAKIAQNASFEWLYFWKHLIYPYPLFIDTMTLHHCLYPDWGTAEDYFRKKKMDEPGHGLAFINSQYTRSPYYKDDGKFWSPEFGDHQFWIYNCMDAMVTLEAALKMMQEAQDEKLWSFYQTQYIRPFYSAVRAEWFGTGVDAEGKETAKAAFRERAEELQRDINGIVGFPMNVNSPKVIAEFLYKTRRYQVKLKHGTGKPTADKDTLRYFAEKHNDPVLLKILELRHTLDVISDFLEQPLDGNGSIHTHYRIGGTDGLRWASSKSILGNGVNFQNLPREGITRRLFVAR